MSFTNKAISCRDCGMDFMFSTGEQEFYAQKGFTNQPARCSRCRQARKSSLGARDSYGSRDSYSAYDSYGSRESYDSRDTGYGRQQELHAATCASCGNTAHLPFMPRGDKPVFCAECFRGQRRSSAAYSRW